MAQSSNSVIKIESLANSGDGVGRLGDKVIFVPFTCPGDTIKVKVVQDKKSFFIGEAMQFLEKSDQRVNPECEYFGNCGGCQWQHIAYSTQRSWKQKNLEDVLRRVGKIENLPLKPIVGCNNEYHYRNRIQVGVGENGFYYNRRQSNSTVSVRSCKIAQQSICQSWDSLYEMARSKKMRGKVELAIEGGEINILPVGENSSTELGFRQVNDEIKELIIQKILGQLTLSNATRVLDLYCGRGHWTHLIAKEHPDLEVIGIDSMAANINWATQHYGGQENLQFVLGKVEKSLDKLDSNQAFCIVDPPRSGLAEELVNWLDRCRPENLVYISCHPATLARDLKALTAKSYELIEVQAFDMFPQTPHLECWTLLQSRRQ